jgi:hypothetical protein
MKPKQTYHQGERGSQERTEESRPDQTMVCAWMEISQGNPLIHTVNVLIRIKVEKNQIPLSNTFTHCSHT